MEAKINDYLAKKREYEMNIKQIDEHISCIEDCITESQRKIDHYAAEAERIEYYLENAEQVLEELAQEFKEETTLNSQDMAFLFLAVGLQCARWMFQPKVELNFEKTPTSDRHNAAVDGKKEMQRAKNEAQKDKYSDVTYSRKYPDAKEIFLNPVPYDAMRGTEKIEIAGVTSIGKNITGSNHHTATLGHDPVLGYIFGTINILTKTITFNKANLETNIVRRVRGTEKEQYVADSIGFPKAIQKTVESVREDPKRLPAAVIRQQMHIESDKYTKHGLPISFIPPSKAQALLEEGWNSNELERLVNHIGTNVATIGLQAFFSILINTIIETVYKVIDHGTLPSNLIEVKSKKIIMYSNIIASSSNIVYAAVTKDLNKLDFGGLIVTIYRIATDKKTIKQIKDEFIFGGYEKQLLLKDYEK